MSREADHGRRGLDPGLTFDRLSRAVRQTIALEARIAAGDIARSAPRRRWNEPSCDPRLPAIRRVLQITADAEPDRAARSALYRAIDERLDDEAELALDNNVSAEEIIVAICDDLGLRLDPARLPDDLLDLVVSGAPNPAYSGAGDVGLGIAPVPQPAGPDPP